MSQQLHESSFDLNAAVVDLGMEQSTFAVTNVSDRDVVVTSVQCGLFLPIDPNVYLKNFEGSEEKFQWKETVGMFLVSFDPEEPYQILSGEQAIVKLHARHVSPALQNDRFSPPRESDELVTSYCLISGVRGSNELVGGALLLTKTNTMRLDALDLLQVADYSEQQEPQRQMLVEKILSARSNAEQQ